MKVMRIEEMITNKSSSWLLNKFSLSAFWKCIENSMENMHTDFRVLRANREKFSFDRCALKVMLLPLQIIHPFKTQDLKNHILFDKHPLMPHKIPHCCPVLITNLNNAFSAPKIWTVDDGCLAKFRSDPVKQRSNFV